MYNNNINDDIMVKIISIEKKHIFQSVGFYLTAIP